MIIDKLTGTVVIDSPAIEIKRQMTRSDYLQSQLFLISSPLNQNPPWSRYGFKPILINANNFAGNICFKTEKLYSLTLVVIRPEFGTSWAEWSEEKEAQRKIYHDNLLKSNFGATAESYSFSWGRVISSYDNKAGGSAIDIYYL